MTEQEQLDAVRGELRTALAKKHGLTDEMMEAVPLNAPEVMEKHIKGLAAVLRRAETLASPKSPDGEHGKSFSRTAKPNPPMTVGQRYIAARYTRPDKR